MNWTSVARRKMLTAGRLWSQARHVARTGGLAGVASFCAGKAKAMFQERRLGQSIAGAKVSAAFDAAFGVETTGLIALSDLEIDSPNYLYGTVYKASEPGRFREILKATGIGYHDYTFIDLGSGKGVTLLLASEYPFRAIRGVEFARELHELAEQNIRRFSSANQKCRDLRSVHADATSFEFPAGPLLVYLYHPFEADVLRRVMARLEASYRANPRPLVVAYAQPAAESVIASCDFLGLVRQEGVVERDGVALAAYRIYRSPDGEIVHATADCG